MFFRQSIDGPALVLCLVRHFSNAVQMSRDEKMKVVVS